MSWKKGSLNKPIPEGVQGLIDPISASIDGILPVLHTLSGFLSLAKIFVIANNDFAQAMFVAAKAQIEHTINDWFQDGVFELVVSPWSFEGKIAPPEVGNLNFSLGGEKYEVDYSLGAVKYDLATGIPKLSPADVISAMIASFDDTGDENRPRLSSTEEVTAFGILLNVPTATDLYALLLSIKEVFTWSNMDFDLYRLGRALGKPPLSQLPDWESISSRSFFPFSILSNVLDDLIHQMNGTTVTADKALLNLISAISGKFDKVAEILIRINTIIHNFEKVSGVFFFDLPPTRGGNDIIKSNLTDSLLQNPCMPDGFSMGILMVGSGASFHSVNVLRGLLKGEPTENLPLP